jgi:hypothetical protein
MAKVPTKKARKMRETNKKIRKGSRDCERLKERRRRTIVKMVPRKVERVELKEG